jgi:hypothetical protein
MDPNTLEDRTAICGIDCFNGEFFHTNLKIYNLTAIKNRGIEAWAAEVADIRKRYFRGAFKIGAGPQLTERK